MRQFVVIVLMVVTAASTAGCSTPMSHASSSARPIRSPEAPDATYSSTTTAPCIPTSTTTTTTALPAAIGLGTPASLSLNYGTATEPKIVGEQVTVNRAWFGATPVLITDGPEGQPSSTVAEALGRLLRNAQLPPTQKVTWIGIEMTVSTSGAFPIASMGAGGPGVPFFTIVVNGSLKSSLASDLALSAFEIGVAGCPFAWKSGFGSTPFLVGQRLLRPCRASGHHRVIRRVRAHHHQWLRSGAPGCTLANLTHESSTVSAIVKRSNQLLGCP